MKPKHIAQYEQEMLDWYSGTGKWSGELYDPTHLVQLARVKYAHAPQAAEALARCTRVWQLSPGYTYCVDPRTHHGIIGNIHLPIPGSGCWLVAFRTQDVVHGFEWLESDPEEWMREWEGQRSRKALRVVHRG